MVKTQKYQILPKLEHGSRLQAGVHPGGLFGYLDRPLCTTSTQH